MSQNSLSEHICKLVKHISTTPITIPILSRFTMTEKQLQARAVKIERRRKKTQLLVAELQQKIRS